MFGTIRKHQTWLWIIIIAITVVSFVIFFSPDAKWSGLSRGSSHYDLGSINGEPIGTEEYREAYDEVRLSHFFRSNGREWPGNDASSTDSLQREAVSRVFLIRQIKAMNITPSLAAVGRMMRDRIGDYPYEKFEQDHLIQQRLTRIDFERFMRHECAILQLVQAASIGARLVNPRDAEAYFRKENEEYALQLAVFWASNYLSQVTVAPAAVSNYFNIRASEYRIPPRIFVDYVAFPASNHLAEADKYMNGLTNLDALLGEEFFRRGGTNTFTGADGKPLAEEEAKKRLKEEIRLGRALQLARREASVFGNELYNQPDANRVESFEKLAAAKGLAVKVTPPFSRTAGLDDTEFPPEFETKAFALSTNAPIAFSPIVGTNAVYVLARKGELASEMPAFDRIQDKVIADFKQAQALDLARAAGRSFHTNLTNGLVLKKSFIELAAENKVKTVIVPPFSPASAESLTNLAVKINPRMLNNIAAELEVGHASMFIPHADGGLIVYLSGKIPAPDDKVKAELPEFMGRLRAYRQMEAFNQWFRRQAEQSKLAMPRREEPTVSSSGQPPPGPSSQPQPQPQ